MARKVGLAMAIGLLAATASAALAQRRPPDRASGPSFDCARARAGSIDRVICGDAELSLLDRAMALDYARARLETPPIRAPRLLQEQRAFLANRDRCLRRRADRQPCIAFAYESRIARLGEWIDRSAWQEK